MNILLLLMIIWLSKLLILIIKKLTQIIYIISSIFWNLAVYYLENIINLNILFINSILFILFH